MQLTRIEEDFRDVGLLCGGVFLLRPSDALRFVEEHRAAGIQILGIEGFQVFNGGRIQPRQEHSIDLDFEVGDTHQQAKDFIGKRSKQEVWFEVVSADR